MQEPTSGIVNPKDQAADTPESSASRVDSWSVGLLVASGFMLAAMAICISVHFKLPQRGSQNFTVVPADNTLVWYHEESDSTVQSLDLQTGQVCTVPLRSVSSVGKPNSRGERIRVWDCAVEVLDAKSGEIRWTAKLPAGSNFDELVGDHFLIEVAEARLRVIDIDDAQNAPLAESGCDKRLKAFEFQPFEISVTGQRPALKWIPWDRTILPIPRSNRFISENPGCSPPLVSVYEVESHTLNLVTSWPVGGTRALAIVREGDVLSMSTDGKSLEVRSLVDFQLRERRPMPAALIGQWHNGKVRNGIFSIFNSTTGLLETYYLAGLSKAEGVAFAPSSYALPEEGDNVRYTLHDGPNEMAGNMGVLAGEQIQILDSRQRRIVYDEVSLARLAATGIVGHGELAIATEELGLTVSVIDIETGLTIRRLVPFLWVLWALPLLLCLSCVWLIAWVRVSAFNRIPLFLRVPLAAGLFSVPLLHRLYAIDRISDLLLPSLGFALSSLLAMTFCLLIFSTFHSARPLIRSALVLLWLAAILYIPGILSQLAGSPNVRPLQLIAFVVLGFLVCGWVALRLLKLVGLRCEFQVRSDFVVKLTQAPAIQMRDIFVFMTAVAILVQAAMPYREIAFSPPQVLITFAAGLFLTIPALLGMVGLQKYDRVHRLATMLACVIALAVIVELTLHLLVADLLVQPITSFIRCVVVTGLATFAYCSIMRAAGVYWTN